MDKKGIACISCGEYRVYVTHELSKRGMTSYTEPCPCGAPAAHLIRFNKAESAKRLPAIKKFLEETESK